MMLIQLLFASATTAQEAPSEPPEDTVKQQPAPFDRQPYKIKAICSFSNDTQLTPRLRSDILRRLRNHTAEFVGEAWEMELKDVSGTFAASSADQVRLLTEKQIELFTPSQDKVFVFAVRSGGDRYLLAAREFDVFFSRWGPVFQSSARESGQIARDLVVLASRMFSPVARIEAGDVKRVTLRIKGGRLPTLDRQAVDTTARYRPSFQFATLGWLFRPMQEERNEDREVIGIKPRGWTFYEVERRDGALATCRVNTGVRNPLPAIPQNLDDPQVIAARTAGGSTVIRLVDMENRAALPAMDVELREKLDGATIPLGTTDLDGRITIPPHRQGAEIPVTVFVRHGQNPIAVVPVLPGSGAEPDLPLTADALRLDIEGKVVALQELIIDEVARRTILGGARDPKTGQLKGSLIEKSIMRKDLKQATELYEQLKKSPSMEAMLEKLDKTKAEAYEKRSEDKQSPKVKRMFADTQQIIELYFNPDDFELLKDELEDKLKTAREDATTAAAEEQTQPTSPTSG